MTTESTTDAPLTARELALVAAMQKKITRAEAARPTQAASVRTMLRIALEGGANA